MFKHSGGAGGTIPSGALFAGPSGGLVSWLAWGAVGPAAVALPVNWAADKLAVAAVRWFKRLKKTDDLSRLVKTATASSIGLSGTEFRDLRKLLEKEETWSLLAGREVKDLADQIAACVPRRDGRTAEDSGEAAEIIARGLLEFAVFDLEPDNFQKVVLARLQQMTNQASELDQALPHLHSDLYARLDGVMDLLKRALELQPGPAGRGEITIYLQMLIAWLNTDPWPREHRLGGHALDPAAIERKLRITGAGQAGGQDLDADDQAKRCQRLVILGGPGSGKTWLAKRTARVCAEEALHALAADGALDEIGLPLYTTCSQLVRARGDIREAAVSSALELIGDLGGSRIIKALREFFTERNASTLLVIDSLDEASDASRARERLRQAGSLRPPWRVILTSRPSSWDHQLSIEEGNQAHLVGELRPLRYPDDVEPAIHRWFADKPERGVALAAQIAGRPSLQQAATVPLILAFYCILGGDQPLPEFRHELYKQVINRMLRSPWRSSSGPPSDVDACRAALRTWAWRGAKNHQLSGVGQWKDEISATPAPLSPAGQRAVDHVASPRDLPDYDTDETSRRFVHRAIREHLVAEHVARMPTNKAVKALLPHLWYDPDWEYTAPAAIAMHHKRDQLLQDLTRRAARSAQIPSDLSVIDAGWEFRGFLARVADDSGESDWSPQVSKMIGQAQMELAQSGPVDALGRAAPWKSANRQARQALLALLANEPDNAVPHRFTDRLVKLALAAQDERHLRELLLGLLAREPGGSAAVFVAADGLVRLAETAEDKRRVRGALLGLLVREPGSFAAVFGMERLAETTEDKRQAREVLLGLLARETSFATMAVVYLVKWLAETAEDKRRALEALLELLAREPGSYAAVLGVERLAETAEDKRHALEALLELLARESGSLETAEVINGVVRLAETAEDRRLVREALLELLTREPGSLETAFVTFGVARLAETEEDSRQADKLHPECFPAEDERPSPPALLESSANNYLEDELRRLKEGPGIGTEDECPSREALLESSASDYVQEQLRRLKEALAIRREDERPSETLLGLLSQETDSQAAEKLAYKLVWRDLTAEDKRQAREALLGLLAQESDSSVAQDLVSCVSLFDPTVHDLSSWRTWAVPPTAELLAAARRNSVLDEWLAALSSFRPLSS
jgi:hypothetical protein